MDIVTILLSVGVPTFSAMAAYLIKNLMGRIDKLEAGINLKTSDQDVRQLLNDKLDPIVKSLDDIKDQNTKLYDLYIKLITK